MEASTAAAVQKLLDQQEIRDVYNKYARGYDRGDNELLRDVFHPEAKIHFGSRADPAEYVVDFSNQQATVRDATAHYVTNLFIDVDGDVAHVEAYYLSIVKMKEGAGAGFMPAGQDTPKDELLINGGRYVDRLERREDGVWRIALRWSIPDWQVAASAPYMETFLRQGGFMSRRDRRDKAYERPLTGDPIEA
jgi:hypothetical protein